MLAPAFRRFEPRSHQRGPPLELSLLKLPKPLALLSSKKLLTTCLTFGAIVQIDMNSEKPLGEGQITELPLPD